MLDHASVKVSDLDAAKRFYASALEPLGYSLALDVEGFAGFADAGGLNFVLVQREPAGGGHVAFACDKHAAVDALHAAAVAGAGSDNGPPGIRPHYHEHYYAAFVHDADGNNIEA